MPCNAGNSDYANSVYGGQDQQTAAPGQGNLIQMHNPAGLTGGATPLRVGGRKGKGKSRRGGLGLGQLLVPAGLVLANNYTYRRFRGKKAVRSARRGRGRGFRPFSRYLNGGNAPMVKMGGNDAAVAPLKMGGTSSTNVGSAPSVTGYSGHSSLSPALVGGEGPIPEGGVPPAQVGGSTLVDLAVPAGLVYANDRYFNRKRRGVSMGRRPKRAIRKTRGRRVRGGNHPNHH